MEMFNLATTVSFNINIVVTFLGESRTLKEFFYLIRRKRAQPIQCRKSAIQYDCSKWLSTHDLAAQLNKNEVVKCSRF